MEGGMSSLETAMKASSSMARNSDSDQQTVRSNSVEQFYFPKPGQSLPGIPPFFGPPSSSLYLPNDNEAKVGNQFEPNPSQNTDWDPQAIVSNLTFLEQKIKQVKDIVQSMSNRENQVAGGSSELAAKQQLITADLTSIIIQLITTAGSLLPSMKNPLLSSNPAVRQLGNALGSPIGFGMNANQRPNADSKIDIPDTGKASDYEQLINSLNTTQDERDELIKCPNPCGGEGSEPTPMEEHDVKESDDGEHEGENLPPGSYVVLQLEKEEILAPHTHFCLVCGKGFKRDANLRMHMRGHGDEYKTAAALAKPTKDSGAEHAPVTRYSCPFVGCKRNKEHKKFQPLKTILCVKNHYKRSHCDKSYTCSRCNTKKFSVMADLKTHEKHCGRDKWLCSCGTTFSRKDKLFGHVALFQGHTPALPMDDVKVSEASEQLQGSEPMNEISRSMGCFPCSSSDGISNLDMKMADDARGYYSPLSFDPCFGALDDFTRPGFDISEDPFSFLPSGSCSYGQQNRDN